MKILGIVILYFPSEKDVENIKSYINNLDKLIIWDNTPSEKRFINYERFDKYNSRIILMNEGRNVGIGKPLNKAVYYGKKNNYTHLLTMDQDSCFNVGDFEKYLGLIALQQQINSSNNIYIPNYKVNGQMFFDEENKTSIVNSYMTSGTVFPLTIFDKIGFFREDFFVDTIDIEFALRAKKNNISIFAFHSITLLHGAGYQKRKRKFLWKDVYPNEYSPTRTYYMIRNAVITYSLYSDKIEEKEYFKYWFYKRFIFIVLYENNKKQKIEALIRGYLDGKKGIVGEQTFCQES